SCPGVSGMVCPRPPLTTSIAFSMAIPDITSKPVTINPERATLWRQRTATFFPSSSATERVRSDESASWVDAGTPRSGIGNDKLKALRFGDLTFPIQFELSSLVFLEQRNDNVESGAAPTADLVIEPVSASGATGDCQPPPPRARDPEEVGIHASFLLSLVEAFGCP